MALRRGCVGSVRLRTEPRVQRDREESRYDVSRRGAPADMDPLGEGVERGVRDEDTGRYVVEINPDLAKFYGRTQWTQIDWEQRQRLRGKPLALWLHGFYASHAAPYPLSVEYLHKLSGSQTKQLRYFKKNLTQALRDLKATGALKSFEIRDGLVHVWTVPSKSQRKHLAACRPPASRRK